MNKSIYRDTSKKESEKFGKFVLGIDPGISGYFCITDSVNTEFWEMPVLTEGKEKSISFEMVMKLLREVRDRYGSVHVFLEKPVSFGMGTKAAFSYGRGYQALLIGIGLHFFPLTLVEPGKWTKEMHEGISTDLKPKVKSGLAVTRLYPGLLRAIPLKGKRYHDGAIDALLIAGYGLRRLGGILAPRVDAQNLATGRIERQSAASSKCPKPRRKARDQQRNQDDFF